MDSNDERLRAAYGASLEARAERGPHPEPEALLAVAERSGSEADRLAILDHAMSCVACRRELDLIRASVTAAGMPRQRSWFRSPSIGLMALAAMLLIIAGVRMYMASSDVEAGPRLRGGSAVATYPVRWLPTGSAGLAWRPVSDAAIYRLEVVDDAGAAVLDSMVRDTSFVLSDALAHSRSSLSWTVTVTRGDGSTLSSLPVRLAPPNR